MNLSAEPFHARSQGFENARIPFLVVGAVHLSCLWSFCCRQKWAVEADLLEAQERLTNRVGPRGIQTLVETRRREGLMLPFRVTIKRHSRLALVTYWDEDLDRTEEVRACLHVL